MALFLSTLCLLIYQAKITYSMSQESSIILAPFEVWHLYSDNILLSIFLANIFVITFSLIAFKYLSLRSIFALIMFLISILIFILFAEEGFRFTHGNFFWSYELAMQLIYLSYIIDLINKFEQINSKIKSFLILCLSLQFIFGIYYFVKIFFGGLYV